MKQAQADLKGVTLISTEILDLAGHAVNGVDQGGEYIIAISARASQSVKNVSVGYNLKLPNGVTVYGTSSAVQGKFFDFAAGETRVTRFSFKPALALGTYFLSSGAAETLTPEDEIHNYVMLDFVHDALPFVVVAKPMSGIAKMSGRLISLESV